jgi:hypothetical protein
MEQGLSMRALLTSHQSQFCLSRTMPAHIIQEDMRIYCQAVITDTGIDVMPCVKGDPLAAWRQAHAETSYPDEGAATH